MKNEPKRTKDRSPRGRRTRTLAVALVTLVTIAAVSLVALATRTPAPQAVESFTHIHGLEVPAWADGDVFVSTHFGLLRIDAEGRWLDVSEVKHDFMGFSAHPTDEGVLYTSGHPAFGSGLPNPLGLMVSRDGGRTWESRSLAGVADFHALAVQPGNGNVLFGFNSAREPGLYRSSDGGRNWSVVPSPLLMQLGGAYSLAIDPNDAERVFAGTSAGLLESRDGGRSWDLRAFEGVPVTAVRFDARDPARLFAFGAAPESGLMSSRDEGASWDRLDVTLNQNDVVGYIAPSPFDEDVIYIGTYGQSLYRTGDSGRTWTTLAESGVPR